MAMKTIDTNLDMYGNTVHNIRIEAVDALPADAEIGRVVYLSTVQELYVHTGAGWKTAGQVNPFTSISVNGVAVEPVDGEVRLKVPVKASELANDAGYITKSVASLDNFYAKGETYSRSELDSKLQAITQFDFKVMDALPEAGEWGFIYLVPSPSAKTKNTKDEYIWVDGAWEQIGSTQFKLDLSQSADGISINGTSLQDASETQSGLATKEMVAELRGKQDALTAGANISIENGVISATGGAGGGHSSYIGEFGGDGKTLYTVKHGLGTYNIIIQLRTASAPVRYVTTEMQAIDEDILQLTFADPLTEKLAISIMACDKSVAPPSEFTVAVKAVTTPTSVWTADNPTGNPVYVQLFDDTGNEIRADTIQNSEDGFTPVVANLSGNMTGSMLEAKADIYIPFTDQTLYAVDVTQYGFAKTDKFLVQVYVEGMGQLITDISQDSGTGIVSLDFGRDPVSGYLLLTKASMVQTFESAKTITCTHNLGRVAGVQVYSDDMGQLMADILCVDENTVSVSANIPITGYVVVL